MRSQKLYELKKLWKVAFIIFLLLNKDTLLLTYLYKYITFYFFPKSKDKL